MKIKIELEVSPEVLKSLTRVEDLLTAVAFQLKLNEPSLYNHIYNSMYNDIYQKGYDDATTDNDYNYCDLCQQ